LLRNFVLAKVTKTVSAEMLLSAAGLCPQTGKNLGLQLFFGGCFFSMALKIAAQFRRATLSLQYPVCENFSGVVCFSAALKRRFAVCYALGHHTALPVFPGFFPKFFCGREGYFHDTVIAETKPFIVLG